jgi:DNA (cytosine-5)-methyltransferase 1
MALRLLDLFCGAGGAAMGYSRAGFEVIGVDIKPQPHYPFGFWQADALSILGREGADADRLWRLGHFDAIHASPPCQLWTRFQSSQPQRENKHLDLITPTRPLLEATGLPWVIENVPGSPLCNPVQLCGSGFGLGVKRGQLLRHRLFEASFPLQALPCHHAGPSVMVAGHGVDGYRGNGLNAAEARQAMGIDWMNRDEMAEAVPPAYTEWIGRQLIRALEVAA